MWTAPNMYIVHGDLIQPVCQAFESWPVVRIIVPAFKHQIVPGQENKKSNRIEFVNPIVRADKFFTILSGISLYTKTNIA